MWKCNAETPGLVAWHDDRSDWSIDARGGPHAIRLLDVDVQQSSANEPGEIEFFRLAAVDDEPFPLLSEQFVRGNELHLWYEQSEGTFGVRVALEPIESSSHRLVLEATISIQTSLLDTHPMLDIVMVAEQIRHGGPRGSKGGTGAAPILIGESTNRHACVLLGPHDSPFTSDVSTGGEARLRLFGDFLEKGVIRKARPWFVLERGECPSDNELTRLWGDLEKSPLPLTP